MATGRCLLLASDTVRDLELRVKSELGGLLFITQQPLNQGASNLFALWGPFIVYITVQ